MFEILRYRTPDGRELFTEWLDMLRDRQARVGIIARLGRIAEGNFGDHKSCGGGVWELRINLGPGYRLYYGLAHSQVVLLLCGGDKKSQSKDIELARECWAAFKKEKQE